jgi:hypothetical protein
MILGASQCFVVVSIAVLTRDTMIAIAGLSSLADR